MCVLCVDLFRAQDFSRAAGPPRKGPFIQVGTGAGVNDVILFVVSAIL